MHEVNKSITLNLQGMHCLNCAQNIERHFRQNGLSDLNVDFASSTLNLTLPDGMQVSSIIEEIQKLGFKASLKDENGLHPNTMSTVEKLFIICAPLSALLMLQMILPFHWLHNEWVQLILCLPVFLIGLFYFGKSALNSLRGGIPNMDVLIVIGIIASFSYSLTGTLLSLGPDYLFYETAATIITIVLFGNILEHRAVKKTTSAIEELGRLQPKLAKRIEEVQGEEVVHEVSASEIKVGDLILLNSGDHVPADGKIIWGEASIDESMISGESVPLIKTVGDSVIGGTVV
ncbi:MAG: cation-translocating P-type ATPase, partial [SAR324 cluster bacterium]|nr:cation-translocating P-type ATPase [SAR324 cluster bacterium]